MIINTIKNTELIEKLKQKLLYLRESHGVVGVKGGTEVEDMNFEELKILQEISRDILPMIVKIGGPEARNDIRECLNNIKVQTILAPMIESEYAFNNFYNTIKSLNNNTEIHLAINIETITAYSNINQIINHKGFKDIYQVTVGQSDLASSIEKEINSSEVLEITTDIIKRVKKHEKITSVGGKITPISAQIIYEKVKPSCINTRHILINLNKIRHLTFSICEALSFEIELYKYFLNLKSNKNNNQKSESYLTRIDQTKKRMTQRELSSIPNFNIY